MDVMIANSHVLLSRTIQVVRSLSACQGALLLVDATQGVQAQTLSTAKAAQAAGLKLVPVVTKIDLHHANVEVSFLCVPGRHLRSENIRGAVLTCLRQA